MDISYRAFGDVHPLTSSSHWDLAHWHESQGYLDEAIDHYMKDLAICRILEANSGGVVGSVAMTCRDIGRLYVSQNKFESAQLFLDEAYQDYIEIYGSEHPETISTLRVLVDLYEGWHESAPDAGHDSSADDYRRLLMDSSG
jgi:hypothetical protein